LTSERT